MSRIQYPSTWSPESCDALDALFTEARKRRLWFYHNSLAAGPLWFSPDELEEKQKGGTFVWGAGNWRLRSPDEYLAQLDQEVVKAKHERDAVARRTAAEAAKLALT